MDYEAPGITYSTVNGKDIGESCGGEGHGYRKELIFRITIHPGYEFIIKQDPSITFETVRALSYGTNECSGDIDLSCKVESVTYYF